MASQRGREEKHHGRGTNLSALAGMAMRLGLPCAWQGKGTQVVPYVLNRFLTTGLDPVDAVEPITLL